MLSVTFLPSKYAPVKAVTYHVAHWNHKTAEAIAAKTFKEEHGIKVAHYNAVAISELRILQG